MKEQQRNLLSKIWMRSVGPYVAYATMERPAAGARGRWDERMWGPADDLPPSELNKDEFFSPLRFTRWARNNDTVGPAGVLFADLDPVNPHTLSVAPSAAWETSPGMHQAVWFLEAPIENYAVWSDLNRRLTHHTGADPGGWPGAKMLRVPGSVNWKRQAFGRILWDTDVFYTAEYMASVLSPVEGPSVADLGECPPLLDPRERTWVLRLHWDDMSLRGRSMIAKERVSDRSLHIVKTAHELLAGGLSPEAVFNLLYTAPWNKWINQPERLWNEIQRAAP